MKRRLSLVLSVLAVALLALAAQPLFALPVDASQPADARLRMGHFSPDTPPVDVYVRAFDGAEQLVLEGLAYGQVSEYLPLPPGVFTFTLRPAGAAADTPGVLNRSAEVVAGGAYTLAAFGPSASVQTSLVADDLTAPPAGQAKVRLIQAAVSAPAVDVRVVDGPSLADDAPFASTSAYTPVPAGPARVEVAAAEPDAAPVVESLDVAAGTVSSLVVLDGVAGADLRIMSVDDATGVDVSATAAVAAAAPAAVPQGGIAAGAGGLAADSGPDSDRWWGMAVVLGVMGPALALYALNRRARSLSARSG